jgi:hypothetical protein
MIRDYRDHAIEQLADSEALLRARIASLEADVEIYKCIAFQAIARASELRRENEMISSRAYVHRTRIAARLDAAA